MKLFSPAKINLCFFVLHKRKDGFHEIASLMQAISFGDILTFKKSKHETVTTSNLQLACDETNLINKSVRLFRKKTGYLQSFHIHTEKSIPIRSGLGGGSGNVATTLWALNRLSGLSIEEKVLRQWAGEISSDAPFFFSSGTAFVTGRGEVVQDLAPLQKRSLWIAKPKDEGLSTPLVYKYCCPHASFIIDPYSIYEKQQFFNQLESSAFMLRPDLAQLKHKLIELGFNTVVMTGSGSAFFCFGNIQPHMSRVKFIKTTFLSRSYKAWYIT